MSFGENLAEILADLRESLEKSQNELATLPEGSLVHEIRNKDDWYFQFKRMPERFKTFPREYFFAQAKEDDWASQPYEQSSYKTERKIHTTSRGLLVRSKSELAISEAFYKYEVPFRYEQVLEIGTYRVAPDFMPRNKRTER